MHKNVNIEWQNKQLSIAQAAAHVIRKIIIEDVYNQKWLSVLRATIKVHNDNYYPQPQKNKEMNNFYTYKRATKFCYSLQKHV